MQHVDNLPRNSNIDNNIIATSLTDAPFDAESLRALLPYSERPDHRQWSVGEESTPYRVNGPEAPKKLLDIDELAKIYGFKRWTIRTYCSQRKIPFYKIGRRVYFDPAAIDAWIQGHARPVRQMDVP